MQCYADATAASGRKLQIFIGAGALDSTLKFGGGADTDIELSSATLGLAYPLGVKTLLRAGGGWLHNGTLATPGENTFDFTSGNLAFAGLDHRLRDGEGWRPATDLTATLGFTWGRTEGAGEAPADYRAADLRVGGRATWTVGKAFFPYTALRVFGGPVNWEREAGDRTGSDVHHYQVALGGAVRIGTIVVAAEFVPTGEQGASVGVGSAW